jgi:hypothetical protein
MHGGWRASKWCGIPSTSSEDLTSDGSGATYSELKERRLKVDHSSVWMGTENWLH